MPPGGYSLVATSAGLDSAVSRSFLIDRPSTDRWVDVGTAGGARQFKSETNGSINPAVDTIATGDLLIWYWLGDGHSVVPDGSPSVDSSAVLIASATFSIRFFTTGTYQYMCGVHPRACRAGSWCSERHGIRCALATVEQRLWWELTRWSVSSHQSLCSTVAKAQRMPCRSLHHNPARHAREVDAAHVLIGARRPKSDGEGR